MVSLIALVSSGKGTWGQVSSLINNENWDKVYLLCNDFSYQNFEISPSKALKLQFDEKHPEKTFPKLAEFFNKDVKDFEVAVNLSSGTGMEHMAVLSAILKAGLGVRFVYPQGNEVKEFEILDEVYAPQEEE